VFESVLIANRGEIARRIIRTLHRLGIRAVAVYAPADAAAPHAREADLAIAVSSYLSIEEIIAACERTGAQALHPGYGFLSENPQLGRACQAAGVVFVGPPPGAAQLMGDKIAAKRAAAGAGVPVVPGYDEAAARAAGVDAYPLLVKAAAGGGGRGMRVVHRPQELEAALVSARREAKAGFGDERVFIERFVGRARHLEVQVIADAQGTVLHLGERECSLQRRHQKIIEESPSCAVSPQLRETLGAEAVALARAAGYVNAGTVEFIADAEDPSEHYFLEMNARLQVEHPVTELVCGLDLVELQLRVAAGEPLPLAQADVTLRGHAIEARINAEDPSRGFLPTSGRILAYERPEQARVDEAIEVGATVGTEFDSLLAKVIVWGEDRPAAIGQLEFALARLNLLGVATNVGYLRGLLADPDVRAGALDTGLVERRGDPGSPLDEAGVAATAAMLLLAERSAAAPADDPFRRADGWRLGGERAPSYWRVAVGGGEPHEVTLPAATAALVRPGHPGRFSIDGRGEWLLARDGDTTWIGHNGYAWPVRLVSSTSGQAGDADGALRAPMPGQVLLVHAAVGERLSAGDPVVVLESMKMELVLAAPFDGELAELTVAVGDTVALDQPLARIQAVSA
jgi:acetyl-CoA/propionyl-CoA carboxylase biotin carboxyl carrier protein